MPCGSSLINAVAGVLTEKPITATGIQMKLPAFYSRRAIRYAITALIKSGKAKRKGRMGPVYAVETAAIVSIFSHQ